MDTTQESLGGEYRKQARFYIPGTEDPVATIDFTVAADDNETAVRRAALLRLEHLKQAGEIPDVDMDEVAQGTLSIDGSEQYSVLFSAVDHFLGIER